MKLNHDCIRDLLLTLEERLIVDDDGRSHFLSLEVVASFDTLKTYSKADIIYCTQRLNEAGIISASYGYESGLVCYMMYSFITFDGHQYLDGIRDKTIWHKIKGKIISNSGSASFKIITAIAEKLILQAAELA